jgi:anti-anti-sigma factor
MTLLPLIEFDAVGDATNVRLTIRGELDVFTAPLLEARLARLRRERRRVRLDLSPLHFMDIAGARLLRRLTDESGRDQWIQVEPRLQPQVGRVFRLLAARSAR